jgi:UDP:flavonoid glycosyltransferase YjiC (YdhE family)
VKNVYLCPYGVGLGHANRMVMVAEHLRDANVAFSTYGEAAGFVAQRGYRCNRVSPVEFAWASDGSFSIKYSLANIPGWFARFAKQINQETRNMTAFGPSVVVSDSRLSPLFAAKLLKIPSVLVLNQVKLLLSPRIREFRIARMFETLTGENLGMFWRTADRVLVPDLPPPYTISAHNVWDISSISSKIEYVGFTVPKSRVDEARVEQVRKQLNFARSSPVVFIHISGPAQTRMPLIKLCIEAARHFRKEVQFVVSEGRPGGSIEPRRIGESGWYYEWCPVKDEVFAMSDLIVMRGGHTALSQALQYGKPVVTIPIEKHGEQLGNSMKVAELKAGIMLHPSGLLPTQVADAVHGILGDSAYAENASRIMKMAEKLDGIDNVVKIVRSYF